ncbi:large ribosomal subunit protein eL14 [Anopheles ziemanni]|uniref:large ribosomal subunit protein eL14 n=1 Tax=Anopheles ziemanni TaxID=345580 RepID=UPI0026580365|nr:large ribosomal subunit protein eL14 isoform X1 [Anopheles coustani]XP_058125424.1 large ribosomal subunit protein eL14 isoform X2 [Anopheles coustani]XP_058177772.1 large ribosomal subunit protein eL14 [Anopheles ziemanni]
MPFKRFVETGRVAKCAVGKYKGRLVCIVNVIDQNRVLIDGPTSGVPRQQYSVNHLHLTKFRVRFPFTARTHSVRKALEDLKIKEKFNETRWQERAVAKYKRFHMNDFDRFKLRLARSERNRIVTAQYKKLKREVVSNGMLFGKPVKGTKPLPKRRNRVSKKDDKKKVAAKK